MTRVSDSQNEQLVGVADGTVRAVGLTSIMKAFQRMDFDRATSRIHSIEAQEAPNGGIHVLVTGTLRHSPDKPERDFVQFVFLAKFRPPRTVSSFTKVMPSLPGWVFQCSGAPLPSANYCKLNSHELLYASGVVCTWRDALLPGCGHGGGWM